jgi:carbonic anhydrase
MAHTECGLREIDDEELARQLAWETGEAPAFAFHAFHDIEEHVRVQLARARDCRWLPHVDDVRGCILDIATGAVRPVADSGSPEA